MVVRSEQLRGRLVHFFDGAELLLPDRQRLEYLVVVAVGRLVPKARPGHHGSRCDRRAEQFQEQILGERHPAFRFRERLGLILMQPEKLGRPVAGVQAAAGAGMDCLRIEGTGKFFGLRGAARVEEVDELSGWYPSPPDSTQSVP